MQSDQAPTTEHRGKPAFLDIDFEKSPFIVIWEITRACDLKCVHCRAEAIPNRNPNELTWEQGTKLLEDCAAFGDNKPIFVFTGGDPNKHPELCKYISYADKLGLRVAVTPSATPLLTREAIFEMRDAGLTRMAISIDGSNAEIHDNFRKQPGSFDHTMRALRDALDAGLTIQVNTTICKWNINDIDNLCDLMRELGLTLWSAFFLVPTGRGEIGDEISPEQFEEAFEKMYELQMEGEFDIKSTAAPHYRRVVMQHQMAKGSSADSMRFTIPERRKNPRPSGKPTLEELEEQIAAKSGAKPNDMLGEDESENTAPWINRKVMPGGWARSDGLGRAARGVNDANGFVFIDHVGRVHPSGFMPYPAGNVKEESIIDIYRDSKLFKLLRDFKQLKGKCRMCEFRDVCGGARSRSLALTGDPMASEPYCIHVPEALKEYGDHNFWLQPDKLVEDMTPYIEKHGDV